TSGGLWIRARRCGSPSGRRFRGAWDPRRFHLEWSIRHRFLGRSRGAPGGRLRHRRARGNPPLLSRAGERAGLRGDDRVAAQAAPLSPAFVQINADAGSRASDLRTGGYVTLSLGGVSLVMLFSTSGTTVAVSGEPLKVDDGRLISVKPSAL